MMLRASIVAALLLTCRAIRQKHAGSAEVACCESEMADFFEAYQLMIGNYPMDSAVARDEAYQLMIGNYPMDSAVARDEVPGGGAGAAATGSGPPRAEPRAEEAGTEASSRPPAAVAAAAAGPPPRAKAGVPGPRPGDRVKVLQAFTAETIQDVPARYLEAGSVGSVNSKHEDEVGSWWIVDFWNNRRDNAATWAEPRLRDRVWQKLAAIREEDLETNKLAVIPSRIQLTGQCLCVGRCCCMTLPGNRSAGPCAVGPPAAAAVAPGEVKGLGMRSSATSMNLLSKVAAPDVN